MVSGKHTQEDYFLEKAIQGNREGLEYLVSAYQVMTYTIAFKILHNKEDAQEVVQDAFMKAFASLKNFKRASMFSTWLYRIVYNTAVTKLNAKSISTVEIDERTDNQNYISLENRAWNLLRQAERKRYVDIVLNRLKQEDRIIITLYYLAEKTITEICEILEMRKSAVKMRLLRGRKQLEAELKLLLSDELKDLL